jgi:hypothetical protein
MKKLLFSALFLTLLATATNAQKLTIGGKAGASLTKITGQAFKEGYDLGYHLGAFAEIDLSKKWGIQPEVLWNQVNTKHAENFSSVYNNFRDSTGSIQLKYLSIPVLLRYNVNPFFTINVGPQFGILLDQNKTLLKNGEEAFGKGDFSMVAGATISVSKFRVYGRYNIGLNNISDIDNQESWKNQQVQLGVGITL